MSGYGRWIRHADAVAARTAEHEHRLREIDTASFEAFAPDRPFWPLPWRVRARAAVRRQATAARRAAAASWWRVIGWRWGR